MAWAGGLDAVNIFEPSAAAVSNVALDHQEFLGDDIASIAREKGGIFAAIFRRLSAIRNRPPELLESAEKNRRDIARCRARFCRAARGECLALSWSAAALQPADSAMRGEHQIANAATALAVLESMPDSLWPESGRCGRGCMRRRRRGGGRFFPGGRRWWWMLRTIRRRR